MSLALHGPPIPCEQYQWRHAEIQATMTPEDVRHYDTFGFVWVRDCFHQGEVSTLLSEAAKAHAEGWAEPHVVEESAALTQLLVRDGRITGRAKQLLGEECIWSGSELHGASKVRSPNPRPSRQPLPTPPHRPWPGPGGTGARTQPPRPRRRLRRALLARRPPRPARAKLPPPQDHDLLRAHDERARLAPCANRHHPHTCSPR